MSVKASQAHHTTQMTTLTQCSCCQDGAVISASCPRCGKATNMMVLMDGHGNKQDSNEKPLHGPMAPLQLRKGRISRADALRRKAALIRQQKKKDTDDETDFGASTAPTLGLSSVPIGGASTVPTMVDDAISSVVPQDSAGKDSGVMEELIRNFVVKDRVEDRKTTSRSRKDQVGDLRQQKQSNKNIPVLNKQQTRKTSSSNFHADSRPRTTMKTELKSYKSSCNCRHGSSQAVIDRGFNRQNMMMGGDEGCVHRCNYVRNIRAGCQACGHHHKAKTPCHSIEGMAKYSPTASDDIPWPIDFSVPNCSQIQQEPKTNTDTLMPKVFWKRSSTGNFGLLTAVGSKGEKYGLRIPFGDASTQQTNTSPISADIKPLQTSFLQAPDTYRREDARLIIPLVAFLILTIASYILKKGASFYM